MTPLRIEGDRKPDDHPSDSRDLGQSLAGELCTARRGVQDMMKLGWQTGCAALLTGSLSVASAQVTAWDESITGDLSNSGLSPTALTFTAGTNRVAGTTGNAGTGVDRDYFKFTVPVGAELTSLKVLQGTTVFGSSSFIAIQAGPQVTTTPTGGGVENLLGYSHYGTDSIGTNILPTLTTNPSGSLPSGTYSVWVQETGRQLVNYEFEFGITQVDGGGADIPTLPQWGTMLLGAWLCAVMWRQSRQRE